MLTLLLKRLRQIAKMIVIVLTLAALALALAGCGKQKQIMDGEDMIRDILDWTGETDVGESDAVSSARPTPTLVLEANGKRFYAALEDHSSAAAFTEKLSEGPLSLELHDYGGFEKVGALPWDLPTNDARITTKPGDIILYQGNQLTVYYDENTWSFTRLASIGNTSKEALLDALGDGNVTVRFWIEWSE